MRVRECPICDAPTGALLELARLPRPAAADTVVHGCPDCLAHEERVAHGPRRRLTGAPASW